MSEGSILFRSINTDDLPSAPIEITAGERERKTLAAAYELVAVDRLDATVTLTATPGGGVTVEGRVKADIVQTCVVSLVPVNEHIDEAFTVRLVRDRDRVARPGTEIVLDSDAVDPPELLEGPMLDVGALAEEYFALAINPYPRAPGAALPADMPATDESVKQSPFAVLASLAKPRSGGN